jgi:hypothetical protein
MCMEIYTFHYLIHPDSSHVSSSTLMSSYSGQQDVSIHIQYVASQNKTRVQQEASHPEKPEHQRRDEN